MSTNAAAVIDRRAARDFIRHFGEEGQARRMARWARCFLFAKGCASAVEIVPRESVHEPIELPWHPEPTEEPLELPLEVPRMHREYVVPDGPGQRMRVRIWTEVDDAPPTPLEPERWHCPARPTVGEVRHAVGVLHCVQELERFEVRDFPQVCDERPGPGSPPGEARACSCLLCEMERRGS